VEAVIRDDETKPDVAIRRFRELLNDNINILVGGTFAHVSQALNEQAQPGNAYIVVTNGIEEKTFERKIRPPITSLPWGRSMASEECVRIM
jgi:branched-chain amino acid transport system substrate-binding protein